MSYETVIPFGKHKGRTVSQMVNEDLDYAHWLWKQDWLKERFEDIYDALDSDASVVRQPMNAWEIKHG